MTETLISAKTMIEYAIEKFGGLTFGVVVTLLLWTYIVTPTIERQQLDFQAQREILDLMQQQADDQSRITQAIEQILDQMQPCSGHRHPYE